MTTTTRAFRSASLVLWGSLLTYALGVPGTAPAPTGATQGGPARVEMRDVMRWLDLDRNGRIEAFEAAAAIRIEESYYDEDGPEGFSQSEILDLFEERREYAREMARDLIAEYDFDGDGTLSRAEASFELLASFWELDRNRDGALTEAEIRHFDHDSVRSYVMGEAAAIWLGIDPDGDGEAPLAEIDPDEYDVADLDLDGDGTLVRDEVARYYARDARGASFEIAGRYAVMNGSITGATLGRLMRILVEEPQVDRILMEEVPGTMDDVACQEAALLIHRHQFHTELAPGGEAASGGTDFFLAGWRRKIGAGARLGVHSWAEYDALGEREGGDLPRDAPEHESYLEFFRAIGIDPEFYFFTLEAADAYGMHYLTAEELVRFGVETGDGTTGNGAVEDGADEHARDEHARDE
jgi:hypothetical protein